jgi:hypothetical protein
VLISSMHSCFSQEKCGANLRWDKLAIDNQEVIHKRENLEQKIQQFLMQKSTSEGGYNIPVVFHVLHKNSDEMVSESIISSQLEVLNQDFGRTNSDAINTPSEFSAIAVDTEINFCLAQRTPDNYPTSGITYTETSINSFSLYDNRIFSDSLGGKTLWNPEKYLNIYICDLTNVLGFSSFPGGNNSIDGVVIDYQNFGITGTNSNYDKGRTATHEVGHWFNLFHVWGSFNCSSDMVDDTPTQEMENYGCPSHPSPSCENQGDMFQNYMDYSNDACMNLFTNGQKERMHATLNTERQGIINSLGCKEPYEDIGIEENIFPQFNEVVCGNDIEIKTSIQNYSDDKIYHLTVSYKIDNNPIQSVNWNGILESNSSLELAIANETLSEGEHELFIYTSSPNNTRDVNTSNDTIVLNFMIVNGQSLNIEVQTDNYAEETTWQITNDFGEVAYNQNNLLSNTLNNETLCLSSDSCYTFTIFDMYNDGICCDFGNGYISINNELFSGEFNSEFSIDLCDLNSIDFDNLELKLYPNPAKDELNIRSNENIKQIVIFDYFGRIIEKTKYNLKELKINLTTYKSGIYFIQITTENQISNQKILVKK